MPGDSKIAGEKVSETTEGGRSHPTQSSENAAMSDSAPAPPPPDLVFSDAGKRAMIMEYSRFMELSVSERAEHLEKYKLRRTPTWQSLAINGNDKPRYGSIQQFQDELHKRYRPEGIDVLTACKCPGYKCNGFPACFYDAFRFVKDFGLYPEEEYAVKALIKRCKTSLDIISMKDFGWIVPVGGDHGPIIKILQVQPLVGAILGPPSFLNWINNDNLYTGPTKKETREMRRAESRKEKAPYPFHAVLLVGFGGSGEDLFYLFKNSHGVEWGLQGYGRVALRLIEHAFYPIGVECKSEEGLNQTK